jgi:5-methylcytosine-specific restriction enzyme subunit McrC
LFFPDCKELPINEKLFELTYDRKTEDYKRAIQLSRIILLNFHPNLKTGEDDLLAIMFDMNYLWEKYIYWSLKRAIRNRQALTVIDQQSLNFWQAEKGSRLRLKPDIVLTNHETKQKWVIDTKWKYESRTSIEDIRQLYAYGKYFGSKDNYLLYPATLTGDKVKRTTGQYFHPLETGNDQMSDERCGLIFTDLIDGHKLHDGIGELIIAQLLEQEAYSNA